jgi:hypothetical protein
MTKHVIIWLSISCVAVLSGPPRPAVAQQATAWFYALQVPPWAHQGPSGTTFPLSMGIASQVASPGAAIMGHLPVPGAVGEVAVTQAVISVGDEVPLPTYADGTKAQDNEVFWTAQLWRADFPEEEITLRHTIYRPGDQAVATFNGRQFVSAEAHIDGAILVPQLHDFQVLVNVFAFRVHDHRRIKSSSLMPLRPESIGGIKARYR